MRVILPFPLNETKSPPPHPLFKVILVQEGGAIYIVFMCLTMTDCNVTEKWATASLVQIAHFTVTANRGWS